jgi:hypothetical protein
LRRSSRTKTGYEETSRRTYARGDLLAKRVSGFAFFRNADTKTAHDVSDSCGRRVHLKTQRSRRAAHWVSQQVKRRAESVDS